METSIESLWLLACSMAVMIIIILAIPQGRTWDVFGCGMLLLASGVMGLFECLGEEVPDPQCAIIAIGLLIFSLVCIVYCFAIDFIKRGKNSSDE